MTTVPQHHTSVAVGLDEARKFFHPLAQDYAQRLLQGNWMNEQDKIVIQSALLLREMGVQAFAEGVGSVFGNGGPNMRVIMQIKEDLDTLAEPLSDWSPERNLLKQIYDRVVYLHIVNEAEKTMAVEPSSARPRLRR